MKRERERERRPYTHPGTIIPVTMETPPRRPCVSPPPHPTNTNRLPPPLPLVTAAPLLLPQPPPEAPLSRVHQELVSIRRRVRGPTYSTGSVTDNESSLLLSLFALRSSFFFTVQRVSRFRYFPFFPTSLRPSYSILCSPPLSFTLHFRFFLSRLFLVFNSLALLFHSL